MHTLCLALDSRWLQLTDLRELSSSLMRHKAQHYSLGCLGKRKYKKMIGLKASQQHNWSAKNGHLGRCLTIHSLDKCNQVNNLFFLALFCKPDDCGVNTFVATYFEQKLNKIETLGQLLRNSGNLQIIHIQTHTMHCCIPNLTFAYAEECNELWLMI